MEEAPTPSMARCFFGKIDDSVSHPNDSTITLLFFPSSSASPILFFFCFSLQNKLISYLAINLSINERDVGWVMFESNDNRSSLSIDIEEANIVKIEHIYSSLISIPRR
jgi:hypothetical protein